MDFTNIPLEYGPESNVPRIFTARLTDNPTPAGVSTGHLMCGLNVASATDALDMLRRGLSPGHVYWSPYLPQNGR